MRIKFVNGNFLSKIKSKKISYLFLYTLTSCAEFKDNHPTLNTPDIQSPVSTESITKSASFNLKSTSTPHQYEIEINLKKADAVLIRDQEKIVYQGEISKPIVYSISDDVNFNIEVYSLLSSPPQKIGEFIGKSPKDISISGLFLKENTEFKANRIFIDNKEIFINGYQLKLESNELFTTSTKISSYNSTPDNLNPSTEVANGGVLLIKSKTANGFLELNLFGLNGRTGDSGIPYSERAEKGENGHLGSTNMACDQEPHNGRPGHPGLKGRIGNRGYKGGDSGFVKIEIINSSPFYTHLNSKEGHGGPGGSGGPGQLGGEGGDPYIHRQYCGGKKGPDGPQGPRGDQGPPGENGTLQESCLSIGKGEGICFKESI